MENSLVKLDVPELGTIEKSKAQAIKETFEPMVKMLKEFEESYNSLVKESEKEITETICNSARRLRIDIAKVRIQTGKLKDEGKAEYLRAERAIQAVHNIIVWAVTDKENKLKEIENYFEIQEQKRLEKLQADREEKISKYLEDAGERDLASMDEDVWNAYFNQKKKDYEDRITAEKKAEEERKEKEHLDRLEYDRRLEVSPYVHFIKGNPDLRSMDEKEYQELIVGLKKAKSDYDKAQDQIKKDKETAEKKLAKVENELRGKREAEEKEKRRIEAERRNAELAPDKEKLLAFADKVYDVQIPSLQSEEAKQILSDAKIGINQIIQMIHEKVKLLK